MIDKNQIEAYDKRFPESDWKKLTYTFSTEELRSLQEWSPIQKMGEFAQVMLNQILNQVFLKRISVPSSSDVGILYDIITSTAIVYVPRVWCTRCLEHQSEWSPKKAQYRVEGKVYCADCVEFLKQQMAQKIEETKKTLPEKKKKESKEKPIVDKKA